MRRRNLGTSPCAALPECCFVRFTRLSGPRTRNSTLPVPPQPPKSNLAAPPTWQTCHGPGHGLPNWGGSIRPVTPAVALNYMHMPGACCGCGLAKGDSAGLGTASAAAECHGVSGWQQGAGMVCTHAGVAFQGCLPPSAGKTWGRRRLGRGQTTDDTESTICLARGVCTIGRGAAARTQQQRHGAAAAWATGAAPHRPPKLHQTSPHTHPCHTTPARHTAPRQHITHKHPRRPRRRACGPPALSGLPHRVNR